MPTTTNPTPAEISALERRIAEGVMGWPVALVMGDGWSCWSPWHNSADALELLKRLRDQHRNYKSGKSPDILISQAGDTWQVSLGRVFGAAEHPGDHYGPAVCLLADKILRHTKGD